MSHSSIAQTVVGASLLAASATMAQTNPAQLVDALNGVFGKHAGARASHAKGVCVQGHFSPSADALKVTKGPMWQTVQTPLVGRFSVGGGNPKASDKGKTVRGLAVNIGDQWHMVGISAPVFMVATPEEFVEFMAARQPNPQTGRPDTEKVLAFNARTPSTKAQIDYLSSTPVPSSYAQANYWGVNAFKFTNTQNVAQYGRWRIEPQAGAKGLTDADLAQLGDDFLEADLTKRLAEGAVKFNVVLQLAVSGDDVKNPSKAWASTNPTLKLGEIAITALNKSCDPQMFNPAVLPAGEGLAMSEDPTLLVRAGAYAVSLGRRLTR